MMSSAPKENRVPCVPCFLLEMDRQLTGGEGGAANESERFARNGKQNEYLNGKMDN